MLLSESKILIGDDSILARKQLKDILSDLGATHYIEAANGQEAIDKYNESPADIVFLDIVMPVKDGVTATREIVAAHPSAVVIIASSIGTKEQLKNAIEAGAKDFIQKPFSAHNIQRIIEARFNH
ncbi:Chemotaxis protein CheY [Eubacterium plexicaudatum ASF492]|uniref:Stage 0 sporulation protein A homolog n=1 Tax=Eubacterium plexicaudatum ASF492 TaxID=1235802 RepID=N2B7G0_9FIRM|nr:Chemotaxis protein CheY [Eubacterium plexicaudatum ASF492]